MSSPNSFQDESEGKRKRPGALIRAARLQRRWSHQQLARRISLLARQEGDYTLAVESLKVLINRWEHGRSTPNAYNLRLLAVALEVTDGDLT